MRRACRSCAQIAALLAFAALGIVLCGCGGSGGPIALPSLASSGSGAPTTVGPNTLGAARAAAAPLVDGNDADAAWASAPELALTEPAVTLRALYTATDLYVLAVVPDATASFARRAWIWDGTTWKTLQGQSEDRLAIMWNIAAPNFDRVGCLVKCHPGTHDPAGEDDAWLETGKADMWHMKAARYLPNAGISQSGALSIEATTHAVTAGTVTFSGWADDKWIGQWSAANAPDGGRYGDAGAGAETRNRSADKTAPNYVETAPLDFVDAMTLYQTEIDNGEAAQVAGLSAAQRQAAWDRYVALKAAVPERILRTPAGSRADVQQAGIWRDGTWTLEYRRALDTGRPEEDVIFNDLNAKYPFGVAWMDNTDGAEHIPSRLLSLVFLP